MASEENVLTPQRITDRITCRQVLNIMVILGFMFNYMLRVNLTIAIVAMIDAPNDTHSKSNISEVNSQCFIPVPINTSLMETSKNKPYFEEDQIEQKKYPWDVYQKNFILGSFFWGYICTELPGGRLAEIIGTRKVFGYAMLLSSILTVITPWAAELGYIPVIILRVLLGFFLGATWPAIQPMIAKWIPPMDRSKFVSHMMASSLGAAITMPVCGYLIANLGWESVFYVTGIVGIIWSISWFWLVYDSPAEHPRISIAEKNELELVLGKNTIRKKNTRVPWKSLITSLPVWAIVITHGCSVFGYFTIINQLPTYMQLILLYDIKKNGLLSSLPYLGKYLFALSTGMLADHLRKSERLSTTVTRKLFTTMALTVPSFLMFLQIFLGCNRLISVSFFTIALTINGAVTAGYLGNGLDIAPQFSGTIFGMANTLSSLGGFLSTLMVAEITQDNQTFTQWRIVFAIIAGTYLFGALIFLIFGAGEIQPWAKEENESSKEIHTNSKEIIPLQLVSTEETNGETVPSS